MSLSSDRRRAIIVGPRVGSPRELARSLFIANVDPKQFGRDIRVAVDGGLAVFKKIGAKPHFAVGDWDSIEGDPKAALRGIFHLTLPKNKDRSDLYYASRAALSAGANELICLGVTGGRPDHHLATLMDLSEIATESERDVRVVAVDSHTRYFFLSENHAGQGARESVWKGTLKRGQTVSIFALHGPAKGVTLEGFQYPLKNAELTASSHGLSNLVTKAHCSVKLKKGRVVIVVLDDFR